MDSRTRFEGGLSVKEKKEFRLMGSWIPATPEKPIPVRRHFIPVESHGHFIPVESHGHQLGHANWQEMARLPSRYVQEVAKYNGHTTAQQFGHNMMVHQFGKSGHTTGIVNHFNGNGIVDHSNGNGNAGSAERTRMRAYSNYHSFTHILGTNTSHAASLNNTHESIPNMANSPNLYRTSQVSQYGLPIPQRPRFDLNIPPTMENTATSCVATSVQHTAAAINGAKLEKGKLSVTANLSRGKCSTEGEGAQSHLLLPIEHEVHQHHFDGHLNTIVNSSSAVGPRPTKEPKVLEIGESGGGIDLNKTPAQKPPKQRKHRPKVVAEGKLKGATKAAITKATTSEEKPTGKRKYVHRAVKESETDHADKPNGKRKYKRKKIQESATQQTDFVKGTTNFNAEIAGNSCIRALNVDIESNKGETQGRVKLLNNKEMDFSLNADYIGTESIFGANKMHRTNSTLHISKLNRLLAGIQQSAVITNPIPSTNQTQSNCITMLEGQAAEHLISPLNSNPGGSLTVWRDDQCQFNKITDLICPETHKKRRADNGFHSRPYAMPSHAAPFEGSSPRTCVVGYTSQHKRDFESDAVNRRQNYEVSGKTSGLTQSHNLASLTTMKSNMHPPIPKASTTAGDRLQSRTDHMGVPRQKKTSRLAQSSSIPREKGNMVKEQKDPLQDCQQLSASSKVTDYVEQQAKKKVSSPIEEIINHLEGLHLDGRTNEVEEEQNALVLYKGCSKIVPCEIKRHKPRPKVDLDMETERVWKLLMGKEGSEGFEDTDKEKQKWWEEERKVFHGRADSFITRMHLVQGDRCFSKWKGSVVDSVIGVFLTQNVSDHLSSSAFMSLAARFPLSPTSSSMCEKELTNIMVKQPDIGMQTQETIKWIEELLSSSQHDQSNLTLQESAQDWRDYETLRIGTSSIAEAHSHNQEDEVLSSQGSSDSLIVHANGGVGSYPGSNSEAEDFPSGSETNKSHAASSTELQMCSTNLFEEFYCGASRGKLLHERARHGNEQPDIPVDKQQKPVEWDCLRKEAQARNGRKERSKDTMDSLNYESLRSASISEISEAIKERGMNNMLAKRIKEFLDRLVRDHGSIDLEWLRDVPPEKAKDYLLSIKGLGLKSVECVRLLTLHHRAFPVDTNVGRIAVRLGWVPLQPLPESLQLHLLELYPVLESVQKYLWPRLCKLDQQTLYKLHYQLITFGKVFCTKKRPNCNACPMTAECRHFASAFASARLALPGPKEKSFTTSTIPLTTEKNPGMVINHLLLPPPEESSLKRAGICIPIVEEPPTPEQGQTEVTVSNIEDTFSQDPDEIPTISLNMEELSATVQNYVQENMEVEEGDMSKALVVLTTNAVSIPMPKQKNVSRLRTEHQVYQLPDSHPLLKGMDRREPDDPSPYLLAIWTPGETSDSIRLPEQRCESHEPDRLCNSKMCFSCNSIKEANSKTVRGTLLIPCRTAMRGSFPLNGTYFQVNEMFADHESSLNPIDVPRSWIWNLPRRMVYFGTSVSSIFKGLSTQEIQYCFWKGFVCVRGFEQKTTAPRPLVARLHFPASKLVKAKIEKN